MCLDEKPVTLHADVRPASPAEPGREARRDNEHERRLGAFLNGTLNTSAHCFATSGPRSATKERKLRIAASRQFLVRALRFAPKVSTTWPLEHRLVKLPRPMFIRVGQGGHWHSQMLQLPLAARQSAANPVLRCTSDISAQAARRRGSRGDRPWMGGICENEGRTYECSCAQRGQFQFEIPGDCD